MVWQDVADSAGLLAALGDIDAKIAARVQSRGCSICGSSLHSARFPRRPRGSSSESENKKKKRWWRLSFCCSRRDCRKRVTPPSVLFLGRRWYFGSVVIAVCAAVVGRDAQPIARLIELFGMSRKTVKRWRRWWSNGLVETALWRSIRGRWVRPVEAALLPRSLLEEFRGDACRQLVGLLRMVGPLTTTSVSLQLSLELCDGCG